MDWLDLLAVQGTLKSLLQHHSLKASMLQRSAFFTVQLSHPYMTTGKTIALTRWTFVGKVMSLQGNANYNCNELSLTRYPLECKYYFDWQYHILKKIWSMLELVYTAGSISNGSPWVKHLGSFLLSWTHSYPKTQYLRKVDLVTCYMSPFIGGWDPAPLTTPIGPAWLNGSPCTSGMESSMWKHFSSCLL